MSFARVYSAQPAFPEADILSVETDLSKGLYSFAVVGLPDKAVEEARDRISAAIKNSGFASPKSANKKVVISLAPADLRKEGPLFDLPMALCYLLAADEMQFDPEKKLFLGELALDGGLRSVRGVLPAVLKAQREGFTEIYVPKENADEAALVDGVTVFAVETLKDVVEHLDITTPENKKRGFLTPHPRKERVVSTHGQTVPDWSDIRGQENAKRGLEIAAAGRHNIALYGPPGTGKTMLAQALIGILPELSMDEALEVTAIHSLAGALTQPLITQPPFRSPHHTSSYVALVGGGTVPKPGEVTLAHKGVLFVDEFPEFDRRSIEALRQPLEDKVVHVSRAKGSVRFPANFILVAAMNPTTGLSYDRINERERERLNKKISGPIVDRIDMWIEMQLVPHEKLAAPEKEHSHEVRARVARARDAQRMRFEKTGRSLTTNSEMTVRDIDTLALLSAETRTALDAAAAKHSLSPRSYHRVIKLARTIADLDGVDTIETHHIMEALQYRPRKDMFGV